MQMTPKIILLTKIFIEIALVQNYNTQLINKGKKLYIINNNK